MSRELTAILDQCLHDLDQGASVGDCLARYPDHAERLAPLLELASAIKTAPRPAARPAAIEAGERLMFAALAARSPRRPVSFAPLSRYARRLEWTTGRGTLNMRWILRVAISFILAAAILGGVGYSASASAIPGDALYPVKRGTESLRMFFTANSEQREQLERQIWDTRRLEVEQVVEAGRAVEVHFWGIVARIGETSWTVGGIELLLDASTQIEGTPVVGAWVEVEAATRQDGTIVAHELTIHQQQPDWTSRSTPAPAKEHDRDSPEASHTPDLSHEDEPDDDRVAPTSPAHDDEDDDERVTPTATAVHDDEEDDDKDAMPTPTAVHDDEEDDDDKDAMPTPTAVHDDEDDDRDAAPTPTAVHDDEDDDKDATPTPTAVHDDEDDEDGRATPTPTAIHDDGDGVQSTPTVTPTHDRDHDD